MKKMAIFVFSILICLAVVYPIYAQTQKQYVIGASLISKDNLWWSNCGRFLQMAADAHNVKLIILWAQGDQSKQLSDIEDLVQRKVDGILVGPVQPVGSMAAIDTAARAKIPIVTIARMSDSKNYTVAVATDEVEYGRAQGRFISDYFKGKKEAKGIYLLAPVGAAYPVQQHQGFNEVIRSHPNIKLLDTYKESVDTIAKGLSMTEDALVRFGNLDFVVGNNDDLALGALRAAESAGKAKQMIFAGSSGVPMGMQAIYEKRMHFTCLKSPAMFATLCLNALIDVLEGKSVPKDKMLLPVPVTQENVLTVKDPIFGGTVQNPGTYKPQ